MFKKLSVGLCAVAAAFLTFILLFTSAELVMQNRAFVSREYNKLMTARTMGVSSSDLNDSYFRLVDYMHGRVPDINIIVTQNGEKIHMFSDDQEISHMKDVRTLYARIASLRTFSLMAMAVLYVAAALLSIRSVPHSIAKGYVLGTFVILMPVAFIGTWAVLDFPNFWNFFHEALFWNGDWLFPSTSRMIQMLPEEFFRDMVLLIVLVAGAAIVLLLALSFTVIHLWHKREEKRYEAALEARRKRRREKRLMQSALEADSESAFGSGEEQVKKKKHAAADEEAPRRKKKKEKSEATAE